MTDDKREQIGPPEAESTVPARAHGSTSAAKGTRAGKATRVAWIMSRMAKIPDEWNDAARKEAAILFDVSLSTLESDAAEASRRIEFAFDDQQLRAELEESIREAREGLKRIAGDERVHARDRVSAHKAFLEGAALWSQLRGIEPAKKVDVGGTLADFLSLGTPPKNG